MRLIISPTPPSRRPSIVNFALYQPLELDYGTSRTSTTRVVPVLIFALVVIRAELAALLALQLLLNGRVSLTRLIKVGFFFSLVSVGV
jgi:hypothetical protein